MTRRPVPPLRAPAPYRATRNLRIFHLAVALVLVGCGGNDHGAARVFQTTPDGTQLVGPTIRGNATTGTATIRVRPERLLQRIDGAGASITESAAAVLGRLPRTDRDAVMRRLFDPREGLGLSVLRQPMGG